MCNASYSLYKRNYNNECFTLEKLIKMKKIFLSLAFVFVMGTLLSAKTINKNLTSETLLIEVVSVPDCEYVAYEVAEYVNDIHWLTEEQYAEVFFLALGECYDEEYEGL